MRGGVVDVLLGLAVLSVWLAGLGFLRLRTGLDRLHCATFVTVGGGFALIVAAMVQDGVTSRFWNLVALLIAILPIGAAATHALGRALYLRDGPDG